MTTSCGHFLFFHFSYDWDHSFSEINVWQARMYEVRPRTQMHFRSLETYTTVLSTYMNGELSTTFPKFDHCHFFWYLLDFTTAMLSSLHARFCSNIHRFIYIIINTFWVPLMVYPTLPVTRQKDRMIQCLWTTFECKLLVSNFILQDHMKI